MNKIKYYISIIEKMNSNIAMNNGSRKNMNVNSAANSSKGFFNSIGDAVKNVGEAVSGAVSSVIPTGQKNSQNALNMAANSMNAQKNNSQAGGKRRKIRKTRKCKHRKCAKKSCKHRKSRKQQRKRQSRRRK
jgi:hypothetical protein